MKSVPGHPGVWFPQWFEALRNVRLPPLRRHPFSFGNASITKLTFERGRWKLRSLNDRCHLRAFTEYNSGHNRDEEGRDA